MIIFVAAHRLRVDRLAFTLFRYMPARWYQSGMFPYRPLEESPMRLIRSAMIWFLLLTLSLSIPAGASAAPKVHLTGPAMEKPQYVGQAFTIGVSASNFALGWVEVQAPDCVHVLSMAHQRRNYLKFTPSVAGEHTITAYVTAGNSARTWKSSIVITVYPVAADEQAVWMVRAALACVGSTDAEKYVAGTGLSADDDWCAAFIGWCSKQVHISSKAGLLALYAGVNLYEGMREEDIACKNCRATYKARFSATVLGPQDAVLPGDLVFFIWGSKETSQQTAHPGYLESWHGNASHVGLVTAVWPGGFSFVHGNIRQPRNRFGVVLSLSTDEKETATYADWVVAFARPHYGDPTAPQ